MNWIFISIIFITLLILAGSYYAYRTAFFNPRPKYDDPFRLPKDAQYQKDRDTMLALIHEVHNLPFEEITINSFDGLKLYGRYYHTADNAPLQIQMHGYHGTSFRDFCGGHKIARETGHNILLIDQRAHGNSEGKTITFGIKERHDCLSWIQYANKRFGTKTPIILCGVSMGAATVLMASELDLPENVAGIIADCPYSSPKEILCKVCKDKHFPVPIVYLLLRLGALIYGHFNVTECSAIDAVKNTKIPILLIHGEADFFVPTQMSHSIHGSCSSDKMLVTVPEAGHALSYIVDNKLYTTASKEFIQKCLEGF